MCLIVFSAPCQLTLAKILGSQIVDVNGHAEIAVRATSVDLMDDPEVGNFVVGHEAVLSHRGSRAADEIDD